MPLIEVQADFKHLVAAVTRVAVALESLLRVHYGIDLAPVQAPGDAPDAGVTYADDLTTALREADAEARRMGLKAPAEEDNE